MTLDTSEQTFWSAHREIFLTHGYCTAHAARLLIALGVARSTTTVTP
jgi:hypothetical protein